MKITTLHAPEHIEHILAAGLVPMLHGSPGVAKSSIVHQIAKKKNLEVIDLRLSQCDPTDLLGFPSIDKEAGKAGYLPMDTFPIKGDALPEGKQGWLLLLDEFNSAPLAVQAASYKLVLDRQIGNYELHDRVFTIAAGNLATDRAIVNRISTAMQSRMVHLHIELNAPDWIDWANTNGLDHRVISFIGFRPELLNKFDPDHDDFTFTCARTWEFVSKLVKPHKEITNNLAPIIKGAIGEGAGTEFIGYCKIYKSLTKMSDIILSPETANVPNEPSVLYALTGMIAENTTLDNISKIMVYIERLLPEFQVICMQAMFRKNSDILTNSSFQSWTIKNAKEFITI